MIKAIKIKKIYILTGIFILIILSVISFFIVITFAAQENEKQEEKTYIKWVDYNVTLDVMEKTAKLDIESHNNNEEVKLNWIELISYLATKYGGNFKSFKQADLDNVVQELKTGKKIEELITNKKLYSYYIEAYTAVLEQFIGEYEIEINNNGTKEFQKKYGIKAFLPIAKNYGFSHYDDFGNARSYGYKRVHLGNDLMGSIGTPIIAVESGIVEACGWNQYGGWRIGIRSFNGKRYYYYAHLRKNHPYAKDLSEGQIVKAGDVIGYLGMTGYSAKENVNNINVPHLHFGMQLIFDESQKDGVNQIWIDVYSIINFLKKNKSEVYKAYTDTKDYKRMYDIIDPIIEENKGT